MPTTPDPYEKAPDAGHGVEGNEPNSHQEGQSMTIVDPFTEIDWLSFDDEQDRHIEGLFGCGDLTVTLEARSDSDGTIPFVAVRTDPETMLDVDGLDRLLKALTSARQDLARVAGDL